MRPTNKTSNGTFAFSKKSKDLLASRGSIGDRLGGGGVAIGLAATFLLTRYVSSLLYNVPAYDPMTLVNVVAALIVISLCACYLPARRATLVDPIVALREE